MVSHERLFLKWQSALKPKSRGYKYVLILEYKLRTNQESRAAIDEAIRTTQFVRNKALRLWMDHKGVSQHDLQALCAQVAKDIDVRIVWFAVTGSCRFKVTAPGSVPLSTARTAFLGHAYCVMATTTVRYPTAQGTMTRTATA